MRRAPAALLTLAALLTFTTLLTLTACGHDAVPHRTWVTKVCQALGPWRNQLTTLNGQAAEQMKGATTPGQARGHLLRLLDGARQVSEDARAKVAGAGVPDVVDGAVIEQRFVDALTAVRDAYGKAQQTVTKLPEADFYPGVTQALQTLNQEYARAGVDTAQLDSADLRKDFDEVPACT
jgi:hypothetical protein